MVRGGILVKHAAFNTSLLQYLACPLSKDPLRYCEKLQELVNDSLGVAYPVCCTSIGPLTPTQCLKKMLYIYLEEKGESIIVVGVLERTFIWAG
jgi:hypothetical protein